MNTKQAQEKILQLVDDRGGSIQARGKLIPYLADQLRVDCHETWPALEHALGRLKEKGLVNVHIHGAIIRGVERINNDVDSDEAADTTPDTIDQEGITMTTENDQVGEPAEEQAEVPVGNIKDLPYHGQLNLALRTLRHYAGKDGVIHDASSEEILIVGLEISQTYARKLNRDLWKLGLRKTIGRLKKHEINTSLPEVTADMAQDLQAPSPKPEVDTPTPVDTPSAEVVEAETKLETSVSPAGAPITSIAQLEARFRAVVVKLEAEKEMLKGERDVATQHTADLERELKKVRKETGQLIERVCGERDEAQKQLQLLRQAATQPLQVSPETQELLARYEQQEAESEQP